mgnify:CR=1 FL=1
MKYENIKIRVRNDITNSRGETIFKNEIVTINSIWNLSLIHISEPTRPY